MKDRTRTQSSQGTSRRRKWEFPLGSEHDLLPKSKAQCRREIFARFVHPCWSLTLLQVPRGRGYLHHVLSEAEARWYRTHGEVPPRVGKLHTKAELRRATLQRSSLLHQPTNESAYAIPDEWADKAIASQWSTLTRPRPELLCIEFDSTPEEQIDAYLGIAESRGFPALKVWSGALPDWYGRTHIGWHTYVIVLDDNERRRLIDEAEAIGGTHLEPTDRIPGSGYRANVIHLDEPNRYGATRLLDATLRKCVIDYYTVERLQEIVRFLRRIPEAMRQAGWSESEINDLADTWSPGHLVESFDIKDTNALGNGHAETEQRSQDTTRAKSDDLDELIEKGDVHRRYRYKDGRLDRSRMGLAVLRDLHTQEYTVEDAWALTQQLKPGLAKYHGRRRRLETDWKLISNTSNLGVGRKARIAEAARRLLPDGSNEQLAMFVLCTMPGAPAPGCRRLGEYIGCSAEEASRVLRELLRRGWIRYHGPKIEAGDGTTPQAFDLVEPKKLNKIKACYTLGRLEKENLFSVREEVWKLLREGISLSSVLRRGDREEQLRRLVADGAEHLLILMGPLSVAKAKIARAKQEQKHRNARAKYRAEYADYMASRGGAPAGEEWKYAA